MLLLGLLMKQRVLMRSSAHPRVHHVGERNEACQKQWQGNVRHRIVPDGSISPKDKFTRLDNRAVV